MNRPPAFPAMLNRGIVLGGSMWTASVIFFIVQIVAQIAMSRPYSLAANLISDLGNTACTATLCSPLHLLVDGAFVATGLLHWGGAAWLRRAWPPGKLAWAATICLALAGWGLAYAGVFPEDVSPSNHAFGAILGLVTLNLGLIVLGSAIFDQVRVLSVLALAAGGTGLVGLLLFFTAPGLPRGWVERLADYPGAATLVVLGASVLLAAWRQNSPHLADV